MKKSELIGLFTRAPADPRLVEAVQMAKDRLESATLKEVRIGEPQGGEALLKIYKRRLKGGSDKIHGLEETVGLFAEQKGALRTSYAATDRGLIYFWIDDRGQIAGCIIEPELSQKENQ